MRKIFALVAVIVAMIMMPMHIAANGISNEKTIGTAIVRVLLTPDNCTLLYEEVSEMKLLDVIAYDVAWVDTEQRILVFSDERGNITEVAVKLEQCVSDDYEISDCKKYEIGRITLWPGCDFVVIGYANGNIKMYYVED